MTAGLLALRSQNVRKHALALGVEDNWFANCVNRMSSRGFPLLATGFLVRSKQTFILVPFNGAENFVVAGKHEVDNSTDVFAVQSSTAFELLLSTQVLAFNLNQLLA